MRYPEPLKPGDVIGITAPSSGVTEVLHPRLDAALNCLQQQGFRVKEGACLRGSTKHASAPKSGRAGDFTALWLDPEVKAIIPPWGGELLIEILPLLDFSLLAATAPKWVMGYSDVSTLLLPLTLLTGVATAHGACLMEMVSGQTDPLVADCLRPLRGENRVMQRSSRHYQTTVTDWALEPERGFELTAPTRWRVLGKDPDAAVSFAGRLIGGCLDTLQPLIGSRFGDIPAFARKRSDTIIYLENCDFEVPAFYRALWTLRLAGWFEGATGVILGRNAARDASQSDHLSYDEAVAAALGDLGIPVILDADVGHVPPQMTLINGAVAQLAYAHGSATLIQELR